MNSLRSNKLISTTALALLSLGMVSCSSGGSSDNGGSVVVPPPPAGGDSFSLNGATLKGTIKNGYVSVVDANDNSIQLTTGRTSSTNGSFNVSIPASANFTGNLVKIIVTGGDGATMVCDAALGCGDSIAFGDDVNIGSDLSIAAIVPAPNNNGSDVVNVTALTNMAASLAEENNPISASNITTANETIADLFELTRSDLEDIPVIDITQPDGDTSDNDAVRAALVSAGILGAILDSGQSLGAGLNSLNQDLVNNNGELFYGDGQPGSGIGMASILEEASDAADSTPNDTSNMASEGTRLKADSIEAQTRDGSTLTDSSPSPHEGLTDLEQAKAFVDDLQLINAAIHNESSSADIEAFTGKVESAGELLINEENGPLPAMVRGLEYVNQAFRAYEEDNSLTEYDVIGQNFTISITSETDGVQFALTDAEIDGNSVNLNVLADHDLVIDESNTSRSDNVGYWFNLNETSVSGDGNISFTGSSGNDALTMNVSTANIAVTDLETISFSRDYSRYYPSDNSQDNSTEANVEFSVGELEINMELLISETASNGVTFEGLGAFTLVNGEFSQTQVEMSIHTIEDSTYVHGQNFSGGLDSTNLTLSGKFSDADNIANVTLTIDANGTDFSISDDWTPITIFDYSFDDNVITFTAPPEDGGIDNYTYEMITFEEAAAEFQSVRDTYAGDFNELEFQRGEITIKYEVYTYTDENGIRRSIYTLYDADEVGNMTAGQPILRQTFAFYPDEDGTIIAPFTRFISMNVFPTWYRTPELSADFITSPPSNTIDFYNEGRQLEGTPTGWCTPDGQQAFGVFPALVPEGGTHEGYVAETFADYDSCINSGQIGFELNSNLNIPDDAKLDLNFAASVFQDVVGIDPDDSEVALTAYGPANLDQGEITGDLSLILSFAGRRFETDARSFDILEDLTQPVTITNQDDVVLTVWESETGELQGELVKAGTVHGTLSDSTGVPIFTFSDDTFVSIQ